MCQTLSHVHALLPQSFQHRGSVWRQAKGTASDEGVQ